MKKTEETARHWLGRHLWVIMVGALGVYSGYLTGQIQTEMNLEQIKKDIAEHEATLEQHKKFNICTVRVFDWIRNGQIGDKPCKLEVME
ncbi:MAG: hypothetical protein AAF650_01460 [Pseudomonadota bacterium]